MKLIARGCLWGQIDFWPHTFSGSFNLHLGV